MNIQLLAFYLLSFSVHVPVAALLVSQATPPEAVVRRQLDALQQNDMETAFQLASPANKAATGPVDRFATMVQSPRYCPLLKHDKSDILMTMDYVSSWRCMVRVWSSYPCNIPRDYVWHLSKSTKDDLYFGCWMIDAVFLVE